MPAKILLIEDEEMLRFTITTILENAGYEVLALESYKKAMEIIPSGSFDVIFTDIMLEKGNTGMDILKEVKDRKLICPVVIFTGYPSLETASESVRLGAFDYLEKPVKREDLLNTARKAIDHKKLLEEKERYRLNLEAIFRSVREGIISVDNNMKIIEINDRAKDMCPVFRNISFGYELANLKEDCNKFCLDLIKNTVEKKEPLLLSHVECKYKTSSPRILAMKTYPLIDFKKDFCGAVLFIRDETRLAYLENLLKERSSFHNITGISDKMQKVYNLIEALSGVESTVMITGESGTGKELVAEAIHQEGRRKDKPLVKVACSALTETLLESELFGHVKGAFTGAYKDKIGRFEYANGGTLFLDEIGDISPGLQFKLLRVLQEREFEKVGSNEPVKVSSL